MLRSLYDYFVVRALISYLLETGLRQYAVQYSGRQTIVRFARYAQPSRLCSVAITFQPSFAPMSDAWRRVTLPLILKSIAGKRHAAKE